MVLVVVTSEQLYMNLDMPLDFTMSISAQTEMTISLYSLTIYGIDINLLLTRHGLEGPTHWAMAMIMLVLCTTQAMPLQTLTMQLLLLQTKGLYLAQHKS